MNNEQLHRDLGRVEGKLDAVSADVAALKTQIADVLARDNRRRGAALLASSALSALIAFATAWLTK